MASIALATREAWSTLSSFTMYQPTMPLVYWLASSKYFQWNSSWFSSPLRLLSASRKVPLSFSGQAVAEGQSGDRGTVRFSSLRPGLHQVHAGGATDTVRLWNDGTAPPQAVRRLAIVASEQVVRAQSPMNTVGLGGMSGGNLVLGVVTVTSATLGIVAISENQDLQDDVDDLQSQLDELASP